MMLFFSVLDGYIRCNLGIWYGYDDLLLKNNIPVRYDMRQNQPAFIPGPVKCDKRQYQPALLYQSHSGLGPQVKYKVYTCLIV